MISIFLASKLAPSPSPLSNLYIDIGRLQWTRKQRIVNGVVIQMRKKVVGLGDDSENESESVDGDSGGDGREMTEEERLERARMARISKACFGVLGCLVLGSWVAYFWGVATGNND